MILSKTPDASGVFSVIDKRGGGVYNITCAVDEAFALARLRPGSSVG